MPHKCIVKFCKNTSINSSHSFFYVPLNENKELSHTWALRCGLSDPDLNKLYSLKSRSRLCDEHFNANDIINKGTKRFLKKNAMPFNYLICKTSKKKANPSHSNFANESIHCPYAEIIVNPKDFESYDDEHLQFQFSAISLEIGEKKTDNSSPIISDDSSVETNTKINNEPCSSGFCSHYITLIEEKARNHKLNRKVEELEERILCLEELLMTQDVSETNINHELVEEDEVEIKFLDTT